MRMKNGKKAPRLSLKLFSTMPRAQRLLLVEFWLYVFDLKKGYIIADSMRVAVITALKFSPCADMITARIFRWTRCSEALARRIVTKFGPLTSLSAHNPAR